MSARRNVSCAVVLSLTVLGATLPVSAGAAVPSSSASSTDAQPLDPAVPSALGVLPVRDGGAQCGPRRAPVVVGDGAVRVQGEPQVVDGAGEAIGFLRVSFEIQRYVPSKQAWRTVWSGVRPDPGTVSAGATVRATSSSLDEGAAYRLRARTLSYAGEEGDAVVLASRRSRPCHFVVDMSPPQAPVIASSDFVACTADDCPRSGAPGRAGSFSLSPAPGDDDVVGYRWSLSSGASGTVEGEIATAVVTPGFPGPDTISVEARDGLGRYGPPSTFEFFVASS